MGLETWDLWFPGAAATGLSFARARMDPADVVLVHAAPRSLTVEVRDENGTRVAFGERVDRAGSYCPMTRLRRSGDGFARDDEWPGDEDIGRPVILPGGEVGILKSWWNAEDDSEWRWTVEFYNRT